MFLLILHGLVGVALLGAITHQAVAVIVSGVRGESFASRYASVRAPAFTNAVMVIYAINVGLGALIYPAYVLDARVSLQEMHLGWAIGMFEMKEHFGAIGLATLPLYAFYWRLDRLEQDEMGRAAITLTLMFIVWFDFIVGHVVNNIRGLS
jgi:hypothetical protein